MSCGGEDLSIPPEESVCFIYTEVYIYVCVCIYILLFFWYITLPPISLLHWTPHETNGTKVQVEP